MNKVRKLAEELVAKYPALFTPDFNSNKQALNQVTIIRNVSLRNQVAGTITVLMKERAPKLVASAAEEAPEEEGATMEQVATVTQEEPEAPASASTPSTGPGEEPVSQQAPSP